METQDIRWKQRFLNFEKAFLLLKSVQNNFEKMTDLEKEGVIQRFEFTHELAWNVMKDYLTYEGIQNIVGSRSATREAFRIGILKNGELWMQMIESRNETVHTYSNQILNEQFYKISKEYLPEIETFYNTMKDLEFRV